MNNEEWQRTLYAEDRAYEDRQHEIRAAEMAEDDAYEQRARDGLAAEASRRREADGPPVMDSAAAPVNIDDPTLVIVGKRGRRP